MSGGFTHNAEPCCAWLHLRNPRGRAVAWGRPPPHDVLQGRAQGTFTEGLRQADAYAHAILSP